ncbi:beta-ketoacyl synthase N-terminal-like domain-containing protein [Enterobacter ludwigii]
MKKEKTVVIGMACRFPAASNIEAFWDNLVQGRDCISEIPSSRWDMQKFYAEKFPESGENTTYARWAGIIDDFDHFDAGFFNISAREACLMDPQQRLLLQETWHCIEHSGIPVQELQQCTTAVFVGAMAVDYQHHLADLSQPVASHSTLGGYSGLLSNRVSWCFDFKGESVTIDAACSSSLVALHQASQSIAAGECDYAIVAGVNILCHPWKHLSFSKLRMFSPEGRCNTFDISANGYVPGEGIGVIMLTSENRCVVQGATCYGYIDGSAVNHNGKNRSITAPDVTAQTTLITKALMQSGRSVDDINYIEAHGTGTSLGYPIETEALGVVFAEKKNKCLIGSLKTHIGHLEAASGIAGVLKVLLMMSHQTLIKTRNLTQENPLISFGKTPLVPVLENCPWIGDKVAAVNSFGFGGTNAHVIISNSVSPGSPPDSVTHVQLPLLISANSRISFRLRLQQVCERLNLPGQAYDDICSSSLDNHASPWRASFFAQSRQELLHKLTTFSTDTLINKPAIPDGIYIRLLTDAQFETYRYQLPGINDTYRQWMKKYPDDKLRRVLQTVVFYQALLQAGVTAHTLFFDEESYAAACIIGGLASPDSLHSLINGQTVTSQPPLFVIVKDNQVVLPIPPKQIKQAIQTLSVSPETFFFVCAQSRLLFSRQTAFRQALLSWQDVLEAQGIDLNAAMEKQEVFPSVQQSVLLLAILTSLAELNRKWQLKEKNTDIPPVLRLIAGLVTQKRLSPHQAVALFSGDLTDILIEDIAYLVAVTTHTATIRMIITEMVPNLSFSIYSSVNTPLLDFKAQDLTIFDGTRGNILERLCEIWQNGTDILWRQLIPGYRFNAKARPLYPFDTKNAG